MVPDLSLSGRKDDAQLAQVDSFHLYNASSHSTCDRRNIAAAKGVTDQLPAQDIDLRPSSCALTTSCAFCPPLKAVPLASFYKLHRLPPVIPMYENPMADPQQTNGVASVALPQPTSPQHAPDMPERPLPNGVHNKPLEQVVRTPGRQPSPQPTHLGVPGASAHRILQEEGPGYVAPKFEGKELQMDQGEYNQRPPMAAGHRVLADSITCSDGPDRRERLHTTRVCRIRNQLVLQ